tara:strand:+ start:20085 stop:22484 length:2400 start_codon:yes stop_codon:yes gene_type:complete
MLLKKIRLQNIRSYVDETISFNIGSSLLSGDIGCGKSSILLAVEFALFGTSRPDLPAELLMRKGSANSLVELEFVLNGQDIKISRSLKKEKRGIKQLPGRLVINDISRDLMPVELKAEVIKLLGYPEELLGKNKNYIFRYTVYTPQEEMKFILQENGDVRLDVLRKIFGIDKYRIVRDNVLLYCKSLRKKIAEFKIRVEPLSEFQERLLQITSDKNGFVEKLQDLEPGLKEINAQIDGLQIKLDHLQKKQELLVEQREKGNALKTLIQSKVKDKEEICAKIDKLHATINELGIDDLSTEILASEVINLRKEKEVFLQSKTEVEQRIKFLQEQISQEKKQVVELQNTLLDKLAVEKQISQINDIVGNKENYAKKLEDTRASLETINMQISNHNATVNLAHEVCSKLDGLDNCPLCMQVVGEEHKLTITGQEKEKINQASGLLQGLLQQRKQLLEIQIVSKKEMENIITAEKSMIKLSTDLESIKDKSVEVSRRNELIKSLVLKNNTLMPELAKFNEEKLVILQENLDKKQEQLNALNKKVLMQKQAADFTITKEKYELEIDALKINLSEIKEDTDRDFSIEITQLKDELLTLRGKQKVFVMQKTELLTRIEHCVNEFDKVFNETNKLKKYNERLVRSKDLHHWLMEYFVKLTYTIEKHVMSNIHYLFNDLFRQWFSILIDDDGLHARIDDIFSPVIEQNGYEIAFNNLSGGERTSAALAYRLALNRVINDVVHQVNTKNILILDEPTDGFSSEQLDKVRDVLDRLHLGQTIIVSHESKIESFVENVIRIGKEGHQSYVMG